MVPGEWPFPIQDGLVDDLLSADPALGLLVRNEIAARDLESGVEEPCDEGQLETARHRVALGPAGRGRRLQAPALGLGELDQDLVEVERLADRFAHGRQHRFRRHRLRQLRGDMEQLLETGLMALKPLPLLRRLERERRV